MSTHVNLNLLAPSQLELMCTQKTGRSQAGDFSPHCISLTVSLGKRALVGPLRKHHVCPLLGVPRGPMSDSCLISLNRAGWGGS